MTLNSIWETIKNNPGWITLIIVLLFSLVEVSKIKINPWSAIGRGIGKFLGVKEVKDKVDAVDKKVEDSDRKLEELEQKVSTVQADVDTIKTKVNQVEGKVNEVKDEADEREATTVRTRILRFSREIEDGIEHDKEMWDHTMADIKTYDEYVDTHKSFKNGITEPTTEVLKAQYIERLKENKWRSKKN